jgi:subtilisin family serine protease
LLVALAASPVSGGGRVNSGDIIPGHFIVVLADGASPRDVAADHGVIRTQTYRYALNGFAGAIGKGQLKSVSSDPRVLFVKPDRVVTLADKPPHSHDTEDSSTTSTSQTTPTGISSINSTASGTVDVDVAVIDTGIDTDHPDLNVVSHVRCTGTGANRDQNGHGTHVAGTIGAIDNEEGVIGVVPGARLWGVKVLNAAGSGTLSCVAAGIDYVTANADQIEVANMSLGCACTSEAMDLAISTSVAAGITYVVAAGNSMSDASGFSPANHADVITVSAIADFDGLPGGLNDQTVVFSSCTESDDDSLACFSNFGSDVEIAAPGVDIFSTWIDDDYDTISGTSMASSHVAGAAALYLVANPGASPATVLAALLANATPQVHADGFDGDADGSAEPLLNVDGL